MRKANSLIPTAGMSPPGNPPKMTAAKQTDHTGSVWNWVHPSISLVNPPSLRPPNTFRINAEAVVLVEDKVGNDKARVVICPQKTGTYKKMGEANGFAAGTFTVLRTTKAGKIKQIRPR